MIYFPNLSKLIRIVFHGKHPTENLTLNLHETNSDGAWKKEWFFNHLDTCSVSSYCKKKRYHVSLYVILQNFDLTCWQPLVAMFAKSRFLPQFCLLWCFLQGGMKKFLAFPGELARLYRVFRPCLSQPRSHCYGDTIGPRCRWPNVGIVESSAYEPGCVHPQRIPVLDREVWRKIQQTQVIWWR